MKIGFATMIGVEPMPFEEEVRKASERGLDALEVNVGSKYASEPGDGPVEHINVEAVLQEGPDHVLEVVKRHNVAIASLAPMLNLLTSDLQLREERIAYFRKTIDACAALSVPVVVTFAGSAFGMHFWGMPGSAPDHPSNKVEDNIAVFREVYSPLADYAEERGVKIAFETAGRGGGEGNVAHSPHLWDLMFDAVPSPALGLSFDPSHLVWLQIPDIPGVIRNYADRIYHFDGKDTEILPSKLARQGIWGSGWWRYRLPGLGELDWTAILSALRDIDYDFVISIENEDPLCLGLEGVAWAADYLRSVQLPPKAA
jgi:sugar phosphate isomerase/epimerase